MLTELDWLLYPEDCEVLITPHSLSPYLIEKNGSTALRWYSEQNNWKIAKNHQIYDLENIDVFIRPPKVRYLSGLYTWLQWLKRDHNLDLATAEWFAKEFSFLNRHYLPQFHWLLNLARYVNPTCTINFHKFETFSQHFPNNHNPHGFKYEADWGRNVLQQQKKLDFWFYLDDILRELDGKSFNWYEFRNYFKSNYSDTYHVLTRTSSSISNVLSTT
jgi:hypothetical protein